MVLEHLENENEFKRPNRVPALSMDHPYYQALFGYWCGGVWAPSNYMILKGLDKYGYTKDAARIAKKYAALVERAFEETGDIWEKYDITTGKPAAKEGAERKMMGWSAGIYLCAKKYADEHQ